MNRELLVILGQASVPVFLSAFYCVMDTTTGELTYANAILVHTPVHASWLNQVEIYFSLIQRKVLTPNDFASLQEVELRLRLYEELTNRNPQPFNWRFTKYDLFDLLQRLAKKQANCGTAQTTVS